MDWTEKAKNLLFQVLGKGAAGAILAVAKDGSVVKLLTSATPDWAMILNVVTWAASLGFVLGIGDWLQANKPGTAAKEIAGKTMADYLVKL